MALEYHDSQRALQDRFDTRRLADRLGEVAGDDLTGFRQFIESRDLFFLATVDAEGQPQCSYKGGDVGFVRVLDAHHLAFPSYDGNGMFLSLGNIDVNPQVGLLFIDLEGGSRLRVNGTASIVDDDALLEDIPGAQLIVRVRATAVFPNCRRYVHKHDCSERSPFIPDEHGCAPVPDWKRDPWFDGYLPSNDPAVDPDAPSAPAIPRF